MSEEAKRMALRETVTPRRLAKIERTARHRQRGLMVVMEDVHNPHNLQAIARSCDAFGVQHLSVILETLERFDPTVEGRASSSSAHKWLDYTVYQDTAAGLEAIRREGWHLLATVADPDAPALDAVDLTHERLAVLVGNEKEGLSARALEAADTHVTIPMFGMIESFNVSVATALLLYEITRQRRASGRDHRISAPEANALLLDFLTRQNLPRQDED